VVPRLIDAIKAAQAVRDEDRDAIVSILAAI